MLTHLHFFSSVQFKEVEKYIANIIVAFGNFNAAPKSMVFKPTKYREHWSFQIALPVATPTAYSEHRSDNDEVECVQNVIEVTTSDHNEQIHTQSVSNVNTELMVRSESNDDDRDKNSSLKRPAEIEAPMNDRTTRVKKCIETIWSEYIKGKNEALRDLNKLKLELESEKEKVKAMDQHKKNAQYWGNKWREEMKLKDNALEELHKIKIELEVEKGKNANGTNKCLMCNKDCIIYCGTECLK